MHSSELCRFIIVLNIEILPSYGPLEKIGAPTNIEDEDKDKVNADTVPQATGQPNQKSNGYENNNSSTSYVQPSEQQQNKFNANQLSIPDGSLQQKSNS